MKLLLLIFSFSLNVACERSSREKRYVLVYPYGGTYKMVLGIAVPIQIGTRQSLTYAINFQFQYPVAQNITQLQSGFPPSFSRSFRTKREILWDEDRSLIYEGLEKVLPQYGVNGKDCLCKAICENASESFYHEDNGLYGHILHILLTPDYGDGELDKNLDEKYADAMYAGRYGLNCAKVYSDCNYNILHIISMLKTY
ncbi:uncharacterized protein LOC108744052 [Agrilus planipennis]|uniref:Uncharacterized protein LOC108744052 n=1 Tax=Agrilus planipennis TaxID=224129 RepID=A0A1W4XRP9_AGRPL|nr:uncharacterized protein LOC108744052 [Agrilus planipennis]